MICGWFKTTQHVNLDLTLLELANICTGVSTTHEEMGFYQNNKNTQIKFIV